MTEQPPAPSTRPTNPGGGAILRRAYAKLLTLSVAAVAVVLVLVISVAITSAGDGTWPTLLVAVVVLVVASACLLLAISRGRTAVNGDQIEIPGLRASSSLARIGSLVGWLGAIVIVATGFLQNTQDIRNALLCGLLLGAAGLILGVCNDGAHRIAKRLVSF
jgi:hypothetical protein